MEILKLMHGLTDVVAFYSTDSCVLIEQLSVPVGSASKTFEDFSVRLARARDLEYIRRMYTAGDTLLINEALPQILVRESASELIMGDWPHPVRLPRRTKVGPRFCAPFERPALSSSGIGL
jgi:hypothetical protein